MSRRPEPRYLPSGTAADAWVIYLLAARYGLSGGEPDGPWLGWRALYRAHAPHASALWWLQILLVTSAWAAGMLVSLLTFPLLLLAGRSDLWISAVPGLVALGVGVLLAGGPLLSVRALARRLGMEAARGPAGASTDVSGTGRMG